MKNKLSSLIKITALAATLFTTTKAEAQSCLSNVQIQAGPISTAFVQPYVTQSPEWYNITFVFYNTWQRFLNVGQTAQPVYWRVDITRMMLNGTINSDFRGGFIEAPGFFTLRVRSFETHIEKCGYYANVHLVARVYTTLPPVGTQIGIANVWLN